MKYASNQMPLRDQPQPRVLRLANLMNSVRRTMSSATMGLMTACYSWPTHAEPSRQSCLSGRCRHSFWRSLIGYVRRHVLSSRSSQLWGTCSFGYPELTGTCRPENSARFRRDGRRCVRPNFFRAIGTLPFMRPDGVRWSCGIRRSGTTQGRVAKPSMPCGHRE